MALAARLPKLSAAASSPNAEPAQLQRRQGRDGGMLGRRHTPDADPGGHEPRRQGEDAGRAGGKARIGEPEQGHAEDQDQHGAAAVPRAGRRGMLATVAATL
jgi:hypothetical protein